MDQNTLNILITAQDQASSILSGVGGAIQQVNTQAQNLAKNGLVTMQSGFEKVAKTIESHLKVALIGVTAIMGLFVKNTMEMEGTRTAFEGMIGDISKTDTLMKQLVETAKKTPLQFTDVAKNAESLLAFGVSSDAINDKMKMLGDVARGNAVKLGLLTNVYGQVKSAGKLMGQDLLQFTSQGIPLISGLSKHFGVAESKIKKMVETGKVGFSDVDQVLQNLTSNGGIFYQAMERQSKTLDGTVSNLTDTFFSFGRAFLGMSEEGTVKGGGIFSYLAQEAQKLLEYVSQLDGAALAEQLISSIRPVYEFITSNTPLAKSVLAGLAFTVGVVVAGTFGTMAIAVVAATWPFIAIAAIAGGLYYIWLQNQDAITSITNKFNEFKVVLEQLWQAFTKTKEFNLLVQTFTAIWNAIQGLMPDIIAIAGLFGVYFAGAISLLWYAFEQLYPVFLQIWQSAIDLFNAIQPIIQAVLAMALCIAAALFPVFIYLGTLLVQVVKSFGEMFAGAVEILSGLINFIVGIFTGDWNKAWEGIKQIFNGLISFLQGAWDLAVAPFRSMIDAVKNIFRTFDLLQTGKDLIQGLINGVKNEWGNLTKTVTDVANSVTQTFAKLWDQHSPSRVAKNLGINFTVGLQQGIIDPAPLAIGAARSIASGVTDQASNALNNNTTSTVTNTQQPITININGYNQDPNDLVQQVVDALAGRNRASMMGLNNAYT